MPLVSIIMPAYNSGKYILSAVDSVLEQSLTDWELIIVDDCSSDNTPELLQPCIDSCASIHYVRLSRNKGVAAARAEGIKIAKGQFIAFLDSDDLWHTDKLMSQIEYQKKKNADLVYTGARCISDSGDLLDRYFMVPSRVDYSSLLYGNDIICSSVLVRTELIRKYPMQRSDLHEDYICWLSILKDGYKARGINQPLVFYRLTHNSKSRSKLKSAKKTYEVYKFMGVPFLKRVICFCAYAVHGTNRYIR